jgi:hypothetical protein
LDLFDRRWHELLRQIQKAIPGVGIEPGGDVVVNGRVVGSYLAEITGNGVRLRLVERGTPETVREEIAGECFDPLVVDPAMVPELIDLIREAIDPQPIARDGKGREDG